MLVSGLSARFGVGWMSIGEVSLMDVIARVRLAERELQQVLANQKALAARRSDLEAELVKLGINPPTVENVSVVLNEMEAKITDLEQRLESTLNKAQEIITKAGQ